MRCVGAYGLKRGEGKRKNYVQLRNEKLNKQEMKPSVG